MRDSQQKREKKEKGRDGQLNEEEGTEERSGNVSKTNHGMGKRKLLLSDVYRPIIGGAW